MRCLPASPFGRVWVTLLGIGISVAALWIAIRNVDLTFVADRLVQADVRYLLVALAAGSVQVWLRTMRWQLLLPRRPDGAPIAIRRLIPVLLIGYLGNVVLPARLGEVARTYLVSRRESLDPVSVLGTVLLERILDIVTLASFALIVAMSVGAPPWIVGAALLAAVVGAIALVVVITGLPAAVSAMSRRVGKGTHKSRWRDLPGALGMLRIANRFSGGVGGSHSRRSVGAAATLSFMAWPLDALLIWLTASSINVEIGLGGAALISTAAVLSTAVPSAPGYVGTYELAAAFAAQAMGVDTSPALALAVLAHALTILPAATAGAVSLLLMGGSLGAVLPPPKPDA